MSEAISNNKRIAKNTMALYVRSFVTLVISLYTSRMILATLGVEDYGIYNVVGGMVGMLSIISGSLNAATSRFLSYEVGRGDNETLNKTFSSALNIHLVIGVLIIIVGELVGIWFLNNQLNIPAERMVAAHWVLQCSILSFFIGIVNVPYAASIVSHERMSIYAYLGLFEAFAKLAIVYVLYITAIDRLITYGVLLAFVSIFIQFVYFIYCRKNFSECRFRPEMDRGVLIQLSSFIGWAFLGNGAVVVKNQGVTILLNIFCGPVVNAAQGVATQIESVSTRFIYSYMTAANPQIIKLYSANEKGLMHQLVMRSSRFSLYLMLLISLPIILNIDTILNIWLVEVPAHTATFSLLTIVYIGLECLSGPMATGVLATGRIKKYEIMITLAYLTMVVAAYICLKLGLPPESALVLAIIFKIIIICILLYQSSLLYGLSTNAFFSGVIKPIATAILVSLACFLTLSYITLTNWFVIIFATVVSEVLLVISIWKFGLDMNEREFVLHTVKSRLGLNKK